MSRYTPGPWFVRDSEIRGGITGNLPIASMFSVQSQADLDMIEREANAHVMAAGPEMLEVLQKIVYGDLDDSYCIPGQLIMEAEYAIAKAKGKT